MKIFLPLDVCADSRLENVLHVETKAALARAVQ
jgi:hypothetical protein